MHIISIADYLPDLGSACVKKSENPFNPSPTLTKSPGLVLLGASKLFSTKAIPALDALHIKTRQLVVMQILSEEEHPTQVRVGSRLRMDRTTMVKTIDDLEKSGLATRTSNPNDRRSYGLELTEKGRRTLASGLREIRRVDSMFFSSLTAAEQDTLKGLLLRLLYSPSTTLVGTQNPKRKLS